MRVAVFAQRQVPKWVVFSALDTLHAEEPVSVIGWTDNGGGAAAVEWAEKRPGADHIAVASVRAPDTRWMGKYYDSRAAVTTCFKLHAPDRCLVFSGNYWLASGVGRLIARSAEKWGVPLYFFEPAKHDAHSKGHQFVWKEPLLARVVELCDKRSVIGRNVCGRFKGHPSAWHWSYVKGERRSMFWLP